jgi:hypothetical protein
MNNVHSNFTNLAGSRVFKENNIPKLRIPLAKHSINLPKREFGKDLTNMNFISNNTFLTTGRDDILNKGSQSSRSSSNKNLYNLIKRGGKDKEDLKKIKQESLLYNLRPRNYTSRNGSRDARDASVRSNNGSIRGSAKMDVDSEVKQKEVKEPIYIESFRMSNPMLNKYPDPQIVTEYVEEIYDELLIVEKQFAVSPYMSNQTDINEKMRSILIDWLVGVHIDFKLVHETLYVAIYLVDKYLEFKDIHRSKLQLVGISALFIASKYEEIYPPDITKFVNITDNAYSKAEILEMEVDILTTLNFNVTVPSALRFLEYLITISYVKLEDEIMFYCKYILDLLLIECKMLKYYPSLLAAATIYIVLKIKKCPKKIDIVRLSGYTEERLKECAKDIVVLIDSIDVCELKTIKNKYSSSRYLCVAKRK